MSKILVPTTGPDDWRRFLAAPEKQWKAGCSAMELAWAWETARPFPPEIADLFGQSPEFAGLNMILAIPEYRVDLPGGSRPTQNDLFVLARTAAGLVVIMVEGKTSESFGPLLEEWNRNASPGKRKRLDFLRRTLALPKALPGGLRYQLLHRAASPLIVAEQFHASAAVMLVHSFGSKSEGFGDYANFLDLYGIQAQPGQLHNIPAATGIPLYTGWAKGIPLSPRTT